jgi:hypothetical protein
MGPYGLRKDYVCQSKAIIRTPSWMKLITLPIPSTLELLRCMWILGKSIGGEE